MNMEIIRWIITSAACAGIGVMAVAEIVNFFKEIKK